MSRPSSFRKTSGFSKGGNLIARSKWVVLALILSASSDRTAAQAQSPSSLSPELKELKEVKEIFDHAKKAVVKIHGVDEHSEIFGTGFFVDPTGTLYTSYTVGGEAGNFTIEFAGKAYPARQLLADVRSGMAILKIDAVTPALPIGQSDQLEVATPVIAIGYPLDLRATPSFGMIAGFDRKYLGRYFSTTHLRVNVAAQRGEAGAPLLNFKGKLSAFSSAAWKIIRPATPCRSMLRRRSAATSSVSAKYATAGLGPTSLKRRRQRRVPVR